MPLSQEDDLPPHRSLQRPSTRLSQPVVIDPTRKTIPSTGPPIPPQAVEPRTRHEIEPPHTPPGEIIDVHAQRTRGIASDLEQKLPAASHGIGGDAGEANPGGENKLRRFDSGSRLAALEPGGQLLAVLEVRPGRRLRPLRVLSPLAPQG